MLTGMFRDQVGRFQGVLPSVSWLWGKSPTLGVYPQCLSALTQPLSWRSTCQDESVKH